MKTSVITSIVVLAGLVAGVFWVLPTAPEVWLYLPSNIHRDNPGGDSNLSTATSLLRTSAVLGYGRVLCPTYYYQGANGLNTDNERAHVVQAEVHTFLSTADTLGIKATLLTAKLSKSHMGRDRVDCNYVDVDLLPGSGLRVIADSAAYLCTKTLRFPLSVEVGPELLNTLLELRLRLDKPARVRWFPERTSGKTVDAFLEAGDHILHLPVVVDRKHSLMVEPAGDSVRAHVLWLKQIPPPLADTKIGCPTCYIGHLQTDSVAQSTYPFLPGISADWTVPGTMDRFVATSAAVLKEYKTHPSLTANLANGDEYYCGGYRTAEQMRWANVGHQIADVYGTYAQRMWDSSKVQTLLWADMLDRGHNAVQYDYANNPANGGCAGGLERLTGKEPIVFLMWGDFTRMSTDSILAYWRSFTDKGFKLVIQVSDDSVMAAAAVRAYKAIPWKTTNWGRHMRYNIVAFLIYTEDLRHCELANLQSINKVLQPVAKFKIGRRL